MARIFITLMVIFCIIDCVTSLSPIHFTNVDTVIRWSSDLYQENTERTLDNFVQISKQIKIFSDQLITLQSRMNIKVQNTLNSLLDDSKIKFSFAFERRKLQHCIKKIDEYFSDSMKYSFSDAHNSNEIVNFMNSILNGTENLQQMLDCVYATFKPHNLNDTISRFGPFLIHTVSNSSTKCDNYISAQQGMYYLLIKLIMSEMKGFAILTQFYTTKWLFSEDFSDVPYNYTIELHAAKINFSSRVEKYYKTFRYHMSSFSRVCCRCDKRSDFKQFFYCTSAGIHDFLETDTRMQVHSGKSQLHPEYLRRNHIISSSNSQNVTFSSTALVRLYSWRAIVVVRHFDSTEQNLLYDDDNSTVRFISVADQISDVWNNKVITGVRFVTRNNTLHLQIQEGTVSSNGAIQGECAWKELDNSYIDKTTIKKRLVLCFEPLSRNLNSIILESTELPFGYVVTGVRFQLSVNGLGIMVQVYGTPFDIETGYLYPLRSRWFGYDDRFEIKSEETTQHRIEINPVNPDGMAADFLLEYDPQPMDMWPSFPLGGVGLFYKRKTSSRGVIAPEIYTIDVSKYMNSNVKEIDESIGDHLIERQTTDTATIKFDDVNTIIRWASEIYNISTNGMMNDSQEVLNLMKNFCSQLNNLENQMNINLDLMLHTLIDNFMIDFRTEILSSELTNYIHRINKFYNETMTYMSSRAFSTGGFTDFVTQCENSLSDILSAMANVFLPGANRDPFMIVKRRDIHPGFLRVVLMRLKEYRPSSHCNKYVSFQQRMYYIFIKVIMSDMKGFATLMLVYSQTWLLNQKFPDIPFNRAAIETEKVYFGNRMKHYYKVFTEEIKHFSVYFRQCPMRSAKRNINFIELEKFSHAKILDGKVLENKHCHKCPTESDLDDLSIRMNSSVYNCTGVNGGIEACLSEGNSHREYLWWKYGEGIYYGHKTLCTRSKYIFPRANSVSPMVLRPKPCILCICTVDQNSSYYSDNPEIWRISVTKQMSDIWRNKVVTGVRFVRKNHTIHIQIQEGSFSREGLIYSDIAWKKLDIAYTKHASVGITSKMVYKFLGHRRKSMNLDYVQVSHGYAITGVQLKLASNAAFALHVHGTPFNFHTGQLNPIMGRWFEADPALGIISQDIESEIKPTNSDNPTRAAFTEYNEESNKVISFTHTDLRKDAGQTTIPFFDAQPVVTEPPFPLRSVRLNYRGQPGYGGYIILQIETFNIAEYVNNDFLD